VNFVLGMSGRLLPNGKRGLLSEVSPRVMPWTRRRHGSERDAMFRLREDLNLLVEFADSTDGKSRSRESFELVGSARMLEC